MFCHDVVCLTETWLTEFDQSVEFSGYTCHIACRPPPTTGRPSGGVSVYISDRLNTHVEFVKRAEDASYLWLKLKHVVQGCPLLYFCVCYMPDRSKSRLAEHSPYEHLQSDILKFQSMGAQILDCGDMNARTAEEIDYVRIADLQDFIDVPGDIDELPELV